MPSDPKLMDAFYVWMADMSRQLIIGKGKKGKAINFGKSLVVGGADLAYQYTIADLLETWLKTFAGFESLAEITGEIFGLAGVLYGMDMIGLISKENAKVEGEANPSKDVTFMNALMLATQDVLIGRGLVMVTASVFPSIASS